MPQTAMTAMNASMDAAAKNALQRWQVLSTESVDEGSRNNMQVSEERLANLKTGEDVDLRLSDLLNKTLPVKLKLPSSEITGCATLYTYDCFLQDVPSDGDCGFHALQRSAAMYEGKTSIGTEMPQTVADIRSLLVSFLNQERANIEASLIRTVGLSSARNILWRDIQHKGNCTDVVEKIQPLFEELCESFQRSGIRGHWLGQRLGEIEAHLLARALGVMLFSVRAAGTKKKPVLRQEGVPFTFLWKDEMYLDPKGAVVIRFVGAIEGGHFQFVKCGTNTMSRSRQRKAARTKSKKTANSGMKSQVYEEVELVHKMFGVQPSTAQRYAKNLRMVDKAFSELRTAGKDPLNLDMYGYDVIKAIMALLMQRCGPKSSDYEELNARSTGGVVLATVNRWYKVHGIHFSDQESCVVKGKSVSGPPWRSDQVLQFKDLLAKEQAKARSNPVRRAYQLTHDDIAAAMRTYVAAQLGEALSSEYPPGKNPKVNWMKLQTSLMVVASFGSGCRGAELVNLRLGDLLFLGNTTDTTIGATLYGTKAKNEGKIIRRIVFLSWKETMVIGPSRAILMQLVLVHGLQGGTYDDDQIVERPLFPNIVRNQPQIGQRLKSSTYTGSMRLIFKELGITANATEHSPRRGGCGFRYYVLNEHPDYIRDIVGHENVQETFTYIGFHDRRNNYVSQGYGTCGTGIIR